jgi:hypothetical protein
MLSVTAAQGQTQRGSISGNVYDSSGAAVPDATVQLVSGATGATGTLTTPNSGEFVFPDLLPGTYTLTVSHAGFQTQKIDNVEVQVARVTSIPVTLIVAQTVQTVEVLAAAATLETQQTALNSVVGSQAVNDIPLNGRDYRQLLVLTPGFVSGAGTHEATNGNRDNQNNWQIDGVDNNDLWGGGAEAFNQGSISGVAGVLLPIDAIQEFNQQSAGGAEYGRNPGSMVNVVMKGGTNQIHGSAYYFNRNEDLAAQSPFFVPGSPTELRNHNFGGSLGGPLKKDKLFLFICYEGQRFITGNAIAATAPSPAWVNNVETNVLAPYNVPVNPTMVAVLDNLYPVQSFANAPATGGNYTSAANSVYSSDNYVARIDYNINTKNRVYFRGLLGIGNATAPYTIFGGTISVFGEYYQSVPSRQSNWVFDWTSTLTPRLVNHVLLGYNYFLQNFDDAIHNQDPPSFGFNTGVTNQNYGSPHITIAGFNGAAVGQTSQLGRTDPTAHITDDLEYSFGSHSFKFGGELRHAGLWVHYLWYARGDFNFTGTAGPWAAAPAGTFSAAQMGLADFLGGYLLSGAENGNSIALGSPTRNWYAESGSGYVHDNWQVTPRLNLNYGVRYDYYTPYHDPTHSISSFWPTFTSTTPPGLGFPGQSGSPISSLYPPDHHEFAPRFGFAFTPNRGGKTVIRVGWGLYYDIANGQDLVDNGSDSGALGVSRNPGGPNPVFTVFIPGTTYEVVQKGVYLFGASTPTPPFGAFAVDQQLTAPYVQSFNLNVQRQLTSHTLLQVGYVGNQGRKLLLTRNMNQPPASVTPYANFQAARPYDYVDPGYYGDITELMSAATSHYNAMQVSLRNTSWRGLTGQISYTLSHAMDDQSAPRYANPTDNNNFRGDWGNSDFDSRHNISAYAVYTLPQLGHSLPRLTKGWELSAFSTFLSGFPFSVYSGEGYLDPSNTGSYHERGDQVGPLFKGVTQSGPLYTGVQFFNPAAFTVAAAGSFGTTRRNQFYGPAFRTIDFSVMKNTPITEKVKVQLRIEMFNVFNILNLASPDNSVGDPTFGESLSTQATANGAPGIGSGEPFNVQIALKLIW